MSSWHVRAVVWKWPEAGVVDELGAEFLGGGAMVEPGKCGGSGHAKERIYLSIADAPTKIRSGRPYSTPSATRIARDSPRLDITTKNFKSEQNKIRTL